MEVKERTKRLLERSGRIRPREVLDAYRETGFAAVRHKWAWKDEACALTALGVAHDPGPISSTENTEDEANVRDMALAYVESRMPYIHEHYAFGFERGFDGHPRPNPGDDDHPLVRGSEAWERCGWRDGRRAAWAVFDHHQQQERGVTRRSGT